MRELAAVLVEGVSACMMLPECMQGLAALLVQGLSGCKPEEVATLTPEWMSTIGLQQSLTPSRNNGFLNMFGLMRQKATQLVNGQVQHSPCFPSDYTIVYLLPSPHSSRTYTWLSRMFGIICHKVSHLYSGQVQYLPCMQSCCNTAMSLQ